MKLQKAALLAASITTAAGTLLGQQGRVPEGIPHLDHVFVIMMENHGYDQIVGNPNAPFVNHLAKASATATNYYAIAHPSLTNYLEVVGGSNFGVHTDNYPDWHNTSCAPNLISALVATDNPPSPAICPIWGTGTDAATPAIDTTNETQGLPGDINIDGVQSIPADHNIVGKTIADQIAAHGLSWRTYQESLPPQGANNVNISDGFFTDKTDFSTFVPALTPPLTQKDLVALYAAKHNPFVYFRDIQEGGMRNMAGFEGPNGLYADLGAGYAPNFSFIAPNQCDDMHGRGNAGAFCNYDPNDNGTQAGLNPALIQRGDITVQRLVRTIKASKAWKDGRNAIVVLWDENDYTTAPITNRVLLIVHTNYAKQGVTSAVRYNHFSLLKTIESGLGLPCLNHACDGDVKVMSDLFQSGYRNDGDGDNDGDGADVKR